jgi:Mg-chelatase subunit ChlD
MFSTKHVLALVLALAGLATATSLRADTPRPKPLITYSDLRHLVKLGISEAEIIRRLDRSPTLFTLDSTQEAELRKDGASDKLLDYLRARQTQPARIGDITDFVIILDCSGSMADRTRDGPSKMEVARKAVTELIEAIPDGRKVAFIVYGHDADLKCQAVEVVQPLSELNDTAKVRLKRIIARLRPVGCTPIARSLRVAGKELAKSKGLSGVVLITDGMETCHGDPKADAAKLAANPKLTFGLRVVGFDVYPK